MEIVDDMAAPELIMDGLQRLRRLSFERKVAKEAKREPLKSRRQFEQEATEETGKGRKVARAHGSCGKPHLFLCFLCYLLFNSSSRAFTKAEGIFRF
jgi:hypothetical protein